MLNKYMPKIIDTLKNWGTSLGLVVWKLFLTTLIALIIKRLINKLIDQKLTKWIQKLSPDMSQQRASTLKVMISNVLKYTLYFCYVYLILTIIGLPIGTLLAGAGVIGAAIGFGARDLVADVVNGFFILFENQYEVGELINLPDHKLTGTVTSVGIRTTSLIAASGEAYYIRNSKITIVNNLSRHERQIQIEIPLADNSDFEKISQIIKKTTQTIETQYQDIMVKDPQIIGPVRDSLGNFTYRVTFVVPNDQQYRNESNFYAIFLKDLADEGIKVATIRPN